MQALLTSPDPSGPTLPEKQRDALISLLADDDPAIYQFVRRKLLSYGRTICEWLRPHLLSSDPALRRRALELVNHFSKEDAEAKFIAFCLNSGEELDLEHAAGLLAHTQYPDTNLEAYQALYDCWAEELRTRIDFSADAEQVLLTINSYLFDELGFHGNEEYAESAENCYVNRVVDHRTGNPISLCAIYLFVARRLKLPVTGIGLPYHFVCRYQSSVKEVYIDVFRQGRFWTKADCIKHLLNTNHGLHEGHLTPVSSRRMLSRMCANLHQTYSHLEMTEEATRVQRYLVALAK
jgi:regulator of sirC expression with transglutaminase-like and TPR domain